MFCVCPQCTFTASAIPILYEPIRQGGGGTSSDSPSRFPPPTQKIAAAPEIKSRLVHLSIIHFCKSHYKCTEPPMVRAINLYARPRNLFIGSKRREISSATATQEWVLHNDMALKALALVRQSRRLKLCNLRPCG